MLFKLQSVSLFVCLGCFLIYGLIFVVIKCLNNIIMSGYVLHCTSIMSLYTLVFAFKNFQEITTWGLIGFNLKSSCNYNLMVTVSY